MVILVRDSIMELNVANISSDGNDTLKTISKILNKYNATFMEIAGYTDSMQNQNAANKWMQKSFGANNRNHLRILQPGESRGG